MVNREVPEDLNEMRIAVEHSTEPMTDYSCSSRGRIDVHFRNLEDKLIGHIRSADLVVGCVAWLTNFRIVRELQKKLTAIVVQKEDFLKPDTGDPASWKADLRAAYSEFRDLPNRFRWDGLLGELSCHGDCGFDPIRCVGNHNRDRNPAFPRMHNKFVVFCRAKVDPFIELPSSPGSRMVEIPEFCPEPYAVWTGSFNFSKSGTRSFENAVVMYDPAIVSAYYHEWEQIEALSEPLDWSSDWCEPEWRIGS
jgi:hypothetical protein